jgi:sugar O-acyltransferase (sialic acid O-acetyltransferase NeuD family)
MKVIIFGIDQTAQLAHYYLTTDSEHEVVAFSANEQFIGEKKEFCELPIVPFEEVEKLYSTKEYVFFAPMTYRNMNNDRKGVYNNIKDKGYNVISYVSSKATVFDNVIIGENCFILEDNTIQPFVKIGDNVVLWSGNHIGHHGIIENHVFITSHVVISGNCVIGENSFFGVNSTIRDFINIGKYSFIGMSGIILKDTDEYSVYTPKESQKIDMSSLKLRI